MANGFTLLRPFIHALDPEKAHNLGLWALKNGVMPKSCLAKIPALEVKSFGLNFLNPVGLSAGFDKNAVAADALLAQGFGFVEMGTVTPLPQSGNPKPRIFRLGEDEAVINRLGFNNDGLAAFTKNMGLRKSSGIVGANIGKNKDASDAVADYVTGLQAVYAHADYITINISSPNTQGLRDLQQKEALSQLLGALSKARSHATQIHGKKLPLLLKVAPDLDRMQKEDIVDAVLAHSIDGLIISNTTISRPETLRSRNKNETGGLSGKPLFVLSTQMLADFYRLTQGKIPLIGVGGISSAEDAYKKIRNGATLLQLYTALVYKGFGVVTEIQSGLAELLKRDGFTGIQDAVGADISM